MIDVTTEREALDAARADVARARAKAHSRLFIGLYQDGGIGDLMRELAFARAVRRAFPGAWIHLICRDLGPDADGQPLCVNIIRGNGAINSGTFVPRIAWTRAVREFYREFDLFYEVGYCVRTYAWLDLDLQHRADLCLRPFEKFAANFPTTSVGIESTGLTQWQLMAATSGLDVSEDDPAIQPGKLPRRLKDATFVAVHDMAGGTALAKSAPLQTMIDLCAALKAAGLRAVQVGAANDPPIRTAEDFRGLTINGTAAVIKAARMLVDIEGGLGYVARAVGTRRACFFGPTPPELFRFKRDLFLTTHTCSPCWHSGPRWAVNCHLQHPVCRNIPCDGKAIAEMLLEYILTGNPPRTKRAKKRRSKR